MSCRCAHLFARRAGWWWHRKAWMRWECLKCGEATRSYDSIDQWAGRPIHPHMSVAFQGYNTMTGRKP